MRQIAEIESEIGWDFRIGNKDSRDSIALVAVSCKASIIEFLRISLGVILKKNSRLKPSTQTFCLTFDFVDFNVFSVCVPNRF